MVTELRVVQFVIKQIGLPLRGRPILLITRMITNRIGLHSCYHYLLLLLGLLLFFYYYYYYTGTPNDRMFPNTPEVYQMVFVVL